MPGMSARRGAPKVHVEHPFQLLARLLRYIGKHYLPHVIIVVVCTFVSVYGQLQAVMFIQALIDDFIKPLLLVEHPDFTPLAHEMIRVAIFCALAAVATFIQQFILVRVTQGTLRNLRDDLFQHMEKLPVRYFDTHPHGDIMSVYTNDIDTLRQMISQSIPQMLNSAVSMVGTLISMLTLNVPLTFVSLLVILVLVLVSRKLVSASGNFFLRQQRDLGSLNGYIEEMMDGQKVVKVFSHEEKTKEEFRRRNGQLFDSASKANMIANAFGPVSMQIGNLSYVVCAVIGGAMALNGFWSFTLGKLVSYLTLNRGLINPIGQISQQLNFVVMALAGADRIFKLMDEEEEKDEGDITLVRTAKDENGNLIESEKRTGTWAWKHIREDGTAEYVPLQGGVILDHVDFGYIPDKIVLHDVSLYAQPGQKIAFVGSTGAGKTTITSLINRFYDIQEGKILYDGIDIRKIRKADLRRSLGAVLQDTHLFTGTVMENIRFGRLDATDEEVIAAAKLANADPFIRRLPQGYQTILTGDGASLSQGQRQLLAIARAAVANPPVLILDEATSSIDTRTERIVQDGMDKLMAGRTTFVIAHRLSTIRNSDCIMVLEQGRIIERGNHEQLLEQKGRYYQLYTGNRPEHETA